MFDKLFRHERAARRPPATPPDTVIWAIGDLHGRLDLLLPLLQAILDDVRRSDCANQIVIFLGDYIDRGPDSQGVIETLSQLADSGRPTFHFLRGNHEQALEVFLEDAISGAAWLEYGGRETLVSYGVEPPARRSDPEALATASMAMISALPIRHRAFLSSLEHSVSFDDYFFAHAGARPGVPLELQTPNDLMQIRAKFLQGRTAFDRVIVHGHTPSDAVHADHRRIGIDTGAYATGILTAIRLEGTQRGLLQAVMSADGVRVSAEPL